MAKTKGEEIENEKAKASKPPKPSVPEPLYKDGRDPNKGFIFHHRAPHYATAKKMQKDIALYFERLRLPNYPTITGLCMFLGFESRQSFYDYEKREGFSYTIKMARQAIERSYENHLHDKSATGAIFALKNFGWKDQTEVVNRNVTADLDALEEAERQDIEAVDSAAAYLEGLERENATEPVDTD